MHSASRHPHPFKHPNAVLDVVTMVSNPVRWHSRYRLFKQFEKHMLETPHVRLHVCEVAFGERPFEITDSSNPNHLQLRTLDEIWHKENALNLLVQRLPSNWRYLACLDSDIEFCNDPHSWAMEAIQQLQHYKIIQMFSQAMDLGPNGEIMQVHKGFVASYLAGLPFCRQYGGWHPGYGWAYTRDAWNGIGGLVDFTIMGAADDHMAKALIGRADDSFPPGIDSNYKMLIKAWEERAMANIKKDIGFLPLVIKHYFHGPKAQRKYWDRWEIIKHPNFDPIRDLKRDWQGLYMLSDRCPQTRDGIRKYHRERNEDSMEME